MYYIHDSNRNLLTMSHDLSEIKVSLANNVEKRLKEFHETGEYHNLREVEIRSDIVQIVGQWIHSPIYSDKILEEFRIDEFITCR